MIDHSTLEKLDNYQLFELLKNDAIDFELKQLINQELFSRKLSNDELKRLEQKSSLVRLEKEDIKFFNGFKTFNLKYHFKNLALLKVSRRYVERKAYLINLYILIFIGGLLFIGITYLKYFTFA